MKSKGLPTVLYAVALVVVLFNSFFYLKDQLFFQMKDLPEGELNYSVLSPFGDRSVSVYRVDTPEGSAVRVQLVEFNDQQEETKRENIYWEVGKTNVMVGWADNRTLTVDDYPLDLTVGDTYDCRRKTSFFQKW